MAAETLWVTFFAQSFSMLSAREREAARRRVISGEYARVRKEFKGEEKNAA